jgi:hypothetical protein
MALPPCNYKLVAPPHVPQAKDDEFTITIDPPIATDCYFGPASATGGFEVVGWGADGTIKVKCSESNAQGTVTAWVRCETCGPTLISLSLHPASRPTSPAHCKRLACSVVGYHASDPQGEWISYLTTGSVYPWPSKPVPGPYFKAEQEAFEREAKERMAEWNRRIDRQDCGTNCHCVPSTDPKDAITSTERRHFSFTLNFPAASPPFQVEISGSFQLEIVRLQGTCVSD